MTGFPKNRIRELRKARKISQGRLAELLTDEKSHGWVAKLETSQIPLTHAVMLEIGAILGVHPIELIEMPRTDFVRVPLIEGPPPKDLRVGIQNTLERIVAPAQIGGANIFALSYAGLSRGASSEAPGFIVVDPDQRDLKSDHVYLIESQEGDYVAMCCKYSPLRLESYSSADTRTISVGIEPFIVIGRIVFAGVHL